MRWIGLVALLVACTAGSPTDTSDTGGTDTSTTDTGTDTSDTGLGPAGLAHGTVTDSVGDPVVDAQVNLCRAVCSTERTDSSGNYAFVQPLSAGAYSFHVVPPEGDGLAEPLVPYTITDGTDAELDVSIPSLGAAVNLPATTGEIEAAPSLFLTLKQGDLTVTFGDPPTAVQGVLLDSADYPPFEGLSGTVVAVWYLSPVQANAEDAGGLPVRIANDFSLTSGHTYELWRASYWDYAFVKVGDFTASDTELTNAAARLPELSTLVLVDPG